MRNMPSVPPIIKIDSVIFRGRLYVDLPQTLIYLRTAAQQAPPDGKKAINEIADIMERENRQPMDRERD